MLIFKRFAWVSLLAGLQLGFSAAEADVIEVFADLQSGRYIEGANLTGNRPSSGLTAAWSADNGIFASLSCFATQNNFRAPAVQRGCDGSLGLFSVINENNAVSVEVSQLDYSSPILKGWQYRQASLNWHIGRSKILKLRASDSLLGQGFNSLTTSFNTSQQLSERWRLKGEVGLTALQSSAPVDYLKHGAFSVEFSFDRWVAEAKVVLSSSEYRRFVKLDLDQPAINLSFRYRLF